jgi:hypothetical protein
MQERILPSTRASALVQCRPKAQQRQVEGQDAAFVRHVVDAEGYEIAPADAASAGPAATWRG